MIMLQCNISPEKLVGSFDVRPLEEYVQQLAPRPSDKYSCSPNGWMYKKDGMGFIPQEVAKIFRERKINKNDEYKAKEFKEEIMTILNGREDKRYTGTIKGIDKVNFFGEMEEDLKQQIKLASKSEIRKLIYECDIAITSKHTAQLNRKIIINSAYGAMANRYFRYMDVRNASAITLFGQLTIKWAERTINEYMNNLLGTKDKEYVFYIDTDSVYCNFEPLVQKVGLDRFKETKDVVDFLDKFAGSKIEPLLSESFEEMCKYMNNMESKMHMDREVIAMSDLDSKGLGGLWVKKKRYALNVYDNEGVRYAEPELKIMGIETQRSSTPKFAQKALKESIRIMLQEGEGSLQDYISDFINEYIVNYRNFDYKDIAKVSSANNLSKYSDEYGHPVKGCPAQVKGVLAFNRIAKERGVSTNIMEGSKVMRLNLKDRNPYGTETICWESGENIPYEMRDILDYVDFYDSLDSDLLKPLSSLTTAGGISYEKQVEINDFMSMFLQ